MPRLHDTTTSPFELHPPAVPFSMAERYAPSGNPIATYVLVPLGAGVVTFAGLGLICWGAGWQVRVALILAGVAICAVWLILTAMLWRQRLVQTMERVYGLQGPQVERQARQETRVIVSSEDLRHSVNVDFPCTTLQLQQFAAKAIAGYSLAEGNWCGRGYLFSKPKYHKLRDVMIARGLAQWKGEAGSSQSWELTRLGRIVLGRIAGPDEDVPLLENSE